MKFILLFIISFVCQVCHSQTKNVPYKGMWVNSQYEYYSINKYDDNVLYSISPQFVEIDSVGNCRVFLSYEQKTNFGKPAKIKNFGSATQIEYNNGKYSIYLSSIKNNDSFLVLGNGVTPGAGIIFVKYNRK